VFEVARSRLQPGFSLGVVGDSAAASGAAFDAALAALPNADTAARVQAVFLAWLGSIPDSHIVRKRGDAAAQTVMREASVWRSRSERGETLELDPAFAAWDDALKSQGINPGTTADLTVATLWLAAAAGACAAA
jgi:triphosphoribosyl-dephospho-CoA synthase